MNCSEAIKIILSNSRDEDICLFTTGLISRRAFAIKNRQANFYILGSMGLVSSVGLGLALNTERKIIIFDGDGSILMDMGTMAMIAQQKPKNLIHIALDNEAYESTGNQPTISKDIDLSRVAKSMGYRGVFNFNEAKSLNKAVKIILTQSGPTFVLVKLDLQDNSEPARIRIKPKELTWRIQKALSE